MPQADKRPVLELLTSSWVSLLGAALVTTASFSWLFVVPLHLRGHAENPYIGILVFLIIPIVFALGLLLIPLGIFLARRRVRQGLLQAADRRAYLRRLATFFAITTVLNLIIGTQLTYRAVEHMETIQFCGQTCHVMKPEFMAHQNGAHARVECVECHVAPGASAWFKSKLAGTRQLVRTVMNDYHRPIRSALEINRLIPARETCEQCHWPQNFNGVRLRVIPEYKDDESNTRSLTVLMMLTGGNRYGGIHGAHVGPGIEIRYAAADAKRQTIPWVEYRNNSTGERKTFLADATKADADASLPRYVMQCVDCHNRPTHTFELPERAVNRAMAFGRLPGSLPYLKKKSVELLKTGYASNDEASREIPARLGKFYQDNYSAVYSQRAAEVSSAGMELAQIYNRNVFPDLKVTWGTYPNNLGHADFPGCFRCHDGAHSTLDQKRSITQDCSACHEPLAVDDSRPEILKALGLETRIAKLQEE